MFKVVFYRVAFNNNMVRNRIEYGERHKVDRASKDKLFDCYCVNKHQLQKIWKCLRDDLWRRNFGHIFKHSIGYQVIK